MWADCRALYRHAGVVLNALEGPRMSTERPIPAAPVRLVEIALGDTEISVDEFVQEKNYVVRVTGNNEPLVLDEDYMQQVVGAFATLGKQKGWL